MRKLLTLLAILLMACFYLSCSKDDNEVSKPEKNKLELVADQTTIIEDQTVNFTVRSKGEIVEQVDIYIDDVKQNNPYTFKKEGDYKVIAKKSGYKDSNSLVISVGKRIRTLHLTTNIELPLYEKEKVLFTITDDTGEIVNDAKILNSDNKEIPNPWSPRVGEHTLIASKEGYISSEPITLNALAKKDLKVRILGNYEFIVEGDQVHFLVYDTATNQKIYDADIYVRDEKVTNPWVATGAGQAYIKAERKGYNTPFSTSYIIYENTNTTGHVNYRNVSYVNYRTQLNFTGFKTLNLPNGSQELVSVWTEKTLLLEQELGFEVEFYTPTKNLGGNLFSAVFPEQGISIRWMKVRIYNTTTGQTYGYNTSDISGHYNILDYSEKHHASANYKVQFSDHYGDRVEININGKRAFTGKHATQQIISGI
ncbi:hypothetical protein VSO92_13960 [Myroides pelagicus]|uniref:hypothetical protein n=1 Tax=Myroides pelagicus TaxID=270914 RepID=UPI002DBADD29|nr:hypothetical protein [Myroides pelagicus]MEC4115205.1 hypothetical protein [Myroides pelagicus]